MSNKQEELKKLNEEKKALNEKQKALRVELEAGKDERTALRKTQAQCRKDVIAQKAKLRDLQASIYGIFSEADAAKVNKLADDIMETAAELAGTVRKFAPVETEADEL